MKLKKTYLFIRFLLLLKWFITKVYSYDVVMKSDDDMSKLYLSCDEINKTMDYHEIRLLFNDEEDYFLECLGHNHFNVYNDLMFLSEKGAVLNYGSDYKSSMKFHILPGKGSDMKEIYFKNLTFMDLDGHSMKYHLFHFSVISDKNDYYIEFENCTFINITGYLIQMEITYKYVVYDNTPQVVFKNCTFS